MTAKSVRVWSTAAALLGALAAVQCDTDQIERLEGQLRVRVINAGPAALYAQTTMQSTQGTYTATATVRRPETVVEIRSRKRSASSTSAGGGASKDLRTESGRPALLPGV